MKANDKFKKSGVLPQTIFAVNCFWKPVTILFLFLSFLLSVACSDNETIGRSDFIVVSDTIAKKPVSKVYCKITGGLDTVYVFANVDYDLFFQTLDEEDQWVKVHSSEYLSDIGATQLILDISPMEEDLLKRTGTLSFSHKESYLGQFVLFSQGFNLRVNEPFDWLKYGSESPLDFSNEVLMKDWTQVQKDYGWTSTIASGKEESYTYGKYGYVKLGSETAGADIFTHITPSIVNDTVLVLSFNAVSFVSETGAKDNNILSLNIVGGGEFITGSISASIELGHYDHNDSKVSESMWKDSYYRFYIQSPEDNRISGDTRIQFVTGTDISSGSKNRVFLDNIILYSVDDFYLKKGNLPVDIIK